jgi:glutamyl-tRNA reductase
VTAGGSDLVVLGVHARTVPIAERERFARGVRRGTSGGLALETCHRVEWIGCRGRTATTLTAALPGGGIRLFDDDAARHVIEVAVGLDSIVVGEDQILHQLRRAVAAARADGSIAGSVDRLMSLALQAGRRARSWRRGSVPSLADAAVAALERKVGSVRDRSILVVGSGEMGRLAGIAVNAAGGRLHMASRSIGRAEALAAELGATSVPFDPGAQAGGLAGIVIALRGRWTPSPGTVDSLVAGRAVVVDLSAPPALEARDAERLGGRLIGIDALAATDTPGLAADRRSQARGRALVEATLAEFRAWSEARGRRTAAAELAHRAERERRAELDELWRHLPELEPDAREAIERMSRHLVGRLLRDPVERLGQDTDGRHERSVRDLWAL